MLERYQIGAEIGSGSFGQVFAAVRKSDNLPVVVKKAKWTLATVPEEIKNNSKVAEAGCSGVNTMLDFHVSDDSYYIVFERRPIDIFDYLGKYSPCECEVRKIVRKVVDGLIEMRQKAGLIHLDVKPENILIDSKTDVVELCDLAFCVDDGDEPKSVRIGGTKPYLAPECCYGFCWPRKSIVWTVGMLAYDCLHNDIPWDDYAGQKIEDLKFGAEVSTDAKDFIVTCLRPRASERHDLDCLRIMKWLSIEK